MASKSADATCMVAGAAWTLTFTEAALLCIGSHAQRKRGVNESVGQLYSRDLTGSSIVIDLATVLPKTRGSYTGVQFNPEVAAQERVELFGAGWHCVGLWHTHPEPNPEPSPTDGLLAKDYARAASNHLNALLFVILGTGSLPHGLSVWLHDGVKFWRAEWSTST